MSADYSPRADGDTQAERRFLERRLAEVERDMGRLAARLGKPTPAVQEMEVLDRARELLSDLQREVHVRTLDDALSARLEWLARAAAHREDGGDQEPRPVLNRIPLDERLLTDLRKAWASEPR